MAQEFKIKAVKSVPKQWDSQYGPMHTWLIQVEGNGEPVQMNKKADSPAPQIGETIYGEITETEYGQKFKSEKRPFQGGGFGKNYQPRDDMAIRAQWAINAALQAIGKNESGVQTDYFADIETYAVKFYAMVARVKGSGASADVTKEKNDWVSPETREKIMAAKEPKQDTVHNFTDEEIDLNDIPF